MALLLAGCPVQYLGERGRAVTLACSSWSWARHAGISGCNFHLSMHTVAAGAEGSALQRKGTAEAAFGEQLLAELCAQLVTRLLSLQRLSGSKTALAIIPLGQEDVIPFLQKGRAANTAQKV